MNKSIALGTFLLLSSTQLLAERTRSHPIKCHDYKFDVGHLRCRAAACTAAKMNALETCVKAGFSKIKVLKTDNDPYYAEGKAFVMCDMVYQCKPAKKK